VAQSRGKRPAVRADRDAWLRLGTLLKRRRAHLGGGSQTRFAKDHKVSVRRIRDIENASRKDPSSWQDDTLGEIADFYGTTVRSMLAVLRGEADDLVLVTPAARPPDARLGPSPITDAAVAAAAQPIADAIWERLVALVYEMHVPARDIPGAALFGAGTDDARDWDDERRKRLLSVSERVYLIANLRVLEHSNNRSALTPVMAVMVAR
jgi:hypothetical protein